MILDTCALLCFAQGGEMLYAPVRKRINSESMVFVSAISGFEIGVKHQKRKLELPAQPSDWFEAILQHHDLQVLPLDQSICTAFTPTLASD